MINNLRLRCVWGVLIGGILLMSILPGKSWLYQISAPYYASDWARFLAFAAVASIPCVAWHRKKRVLYCFSIIALSVVFVFLRAITAGAAGHPEYIISDLLGLAAGVLLGLNLRMMSGSTGAGAGMTHAQRRSTMH